MCDESEKKTGLQLIPDLMGIVDHQVSTAKQYPRSLVEFKNEVLSLVTSTEEIADSCFYTLPRKDKGVTKYIEGPSARFAEVVAFSWRNNRAGAKIVGEDGEFVIAEGFFHDLERNVAVTFQTKRKITDKHGKRFKSDLVGVTGNAAASIAFRNAVLKGVPKAVWQDMFLAARKTAIGDEGTLAKKRSEVVDYFAKIGVGPEELCKALGIRTVAEIGLEELAAMKGIAGAIRSGDSTVEDIFRDEDKPRASASFTSAPEKP